MKRLVFLVWVASVLLPAALSAKQSQVPQGAYIRKPAGSVEELAAHITSDPIVRNHYARHFGVAPYKLSEYIKDNVIITRVGASTPSRVYVVKRDGRLVAERKTLRKGTQIFALKDTGEPLLVLSCGNPVVKKLPVRVKVKASNAQVYQVMRPNELSPQPVPPQRVAALPPVVEVIPAPSPAMLPAVAPPAAIPPVIKAAGPNYWPLAPLLGLLAGHGGGEGTPDPPPVVPPVPEPGGAAAVLATALIPAAGWVIRRCRHGG